MLSSSFRRAHIAAVFIHVFKMCFAFGLLLSFWSLILPLCFGEEVMNRLHVELYSGYVRSTTSSIN